ncbi:MAG: excinuclease ABC subunit A [Methanocella sp. PtaU1.Bin125]|nr:MAG: excinuclease ABC subunit A [Methanocella sp. PtaU1.Bin125]
MRCIEVTGARIHNLKDVDVKVPKGSLVAVTGVSGSGKSSFAFDILFEEGRRRYLQAIGLSDFPVQDSGFDRIDGLPAVVAVEQRTGLYSTPRSTVGTRTGIYYLLRQLYVLERGRKGDLRLRDLSFNEPAGWCPKCRGLGYAQEFHEAKIVPDPSRNLFQICEDGAFGGIKNLTPGLADAYGFDIGTPYRDLPPEIKKTFLYGSDRKVRVDWRSERFSGVFESEFPGVIPHLHKTLAKTSSAYRINKIENEFMTRVSCPECGGTRVGERARSATIGGRHIGELAGMSMAGLAGFLERSGTEDVRTGEGKALLSEIVRRLRQSETAGISYLSLNRSMTTLSGGEIQRLNLMSHLNATLEALLFVLDEPSQGMHELEKGNLVSMLRELKARGNTVVVVEHDRAIVGACDHVIDFGPGAGNNGGRVVYQGPIGGLSCARDSLTGQYLSGTRSIPRKSRATRRQVTATTHFLVLRGATAHNLRGVEARIPLGLMVGVAGVSGSGKSSLVSDTLVPLLKAKSAAKNGEEEDDAPPGGEIAGSLEGQENLSGCVVITQSPIGRTRTSNPASYIGIWDDIRQLFARQETAAGRGYDAGHFSLNGGSGSCPACGGSGALEVQLSLTSKVGVRCEECGGTGYRPEVLEVRYAGKSIREALDMTVTEALALFRDRPRIARYLKILDEMGMGYVTLGQPAPTLSGGEAQRIKLAKALGKLKRGRTLYVLDEPTSGLHDHDVERLLAILDRLVGAGNTVLVIEHNVDVLSYADYLIELGPGGGPEGGEIIASGPPEEIKANPRSKIGPYLYA